MLATQKLHNNANMSSIFNFFFFLKKNTGHINIVVKITYIVQHFSFFFLHKNKNTGHISIIVQLLYKMIV
jgi:hypothetical protein